MVYQPFREKRMKNVLIAVLIMAAIVSSQESKSTGRILGSSTGRYVLGQISDNAKEQFLFDTQTGRLWRLTMTDDSMMVLKEIPYVDINDVFAPSPNSIEEAKLKFAQFNKNRIHKRMVDQLEELRKGKPAMTYKEFYSLCQKQGGTPDEMVDAAKASISKYGTFAEDAPASKAVPAPAR
jgi:hypothetical protein